MDSPRGELERALSTSVDSLLVCDSAGRIVGVNDSLCALTGYDRQDLLGKPIDDLADAEAARLAAGLGGEATAGLEAGVRFKDGSAQRLRLWLRSLRIDGRPHLEVRLARRRRAADRLPEDPEFVRALLGSSGTPVVCVRPDGTALFANAAFEGLVGRPFAGIRGRKLWDLAADPAAAEFRRHVPPSEPGSFETEWPAPWGARTIAWTRSTLAPVPPDPPLRLLIGRDLPPSGEPPGRVAPRRPREDQSPRVRELEERVLRLTRELERARWEHDAFTYTLAHECRAPIRVLTGMSDLLLEEYRRTPADAPGGDTPLRLGRAARQLNAVIESLLAYSRLERAPVRAEALPVAAVLDEVLRSLGPEISDRGARMTVEARGEVVLADRSMLQVLLVHLLSNALKFVRPRVTPEVRLHAEPLAGGIVRVGVSDNGIGISPQYHDRIFGLGERLNLAEDYPGAGMGLALVARAAARMGARVGLESREGGGSVFWVDLPAAPVGP